MRFPLFDEYLERLPRSVEAGGRLWLDARGHAQGRFFHCTLTSAFQPVRRLADGHITGFEAFARGASEREPGLSLWRLLEGAAGDAESVELDRLCRLLHTVNFFRQSGAATMPSSLLYLSVHDRLLAAVQGDHGLVFRRILDGLGLPAQRIVLQLPAPPASQRWLLDHVAHNYRRNGFRVAVNAGGPAEALYLAQSSVGAAGIDMIKIDARNSADTGNHGTLQSLLRTCAARGIDLVFKRLESVAARDALRRLTQADQWPALAQGHVWDVPHGALAGNEAHDVSVPLSNGALKTSLREQVADGAD